MYIEQKKDVEHIIIVQMILICPTNNMRQDNSEMIKTQVRFPKL